MMTDQMWLNLVEALNIAEHKYSELTCHYQKGKPIIDKIGFIADCLLVDGWTKPTCSVGDTLWVIYKNRVYPVTIYAVRTDNKKNNKRICVEGNFCICEPYGNYTHYYSSTFNLSSIGKSIFNSEGEALKSLNK